MPQYFNASLKLHFKCLKNTDKLVLNMKQLELYSSSMSISSTSDLNYIPVKYFLWDYDEETQIFIAYLNENENQSFKMNNNYTFEVEFKGFIKNDNLGFYRTSYVDEKNIRK
jgi:hypothetical protein